MVIAGPTLLNYFTGEDRNETIIACFRPPGWLVRGRWTGGLGVFRNLEFICENDLGEGTLSRSNETKHVAIASSEEC